MTLTESVQWHVDALVKANTPLPAGVKSMEFLIRDKPNTPVTLEFVCNVDGKPSKIMTPSIKIESSDMVMKLLGNLVEGVRAVGYKLNHI